MARTSSTVTIDATLRCGRMERSRIAEFDDPRLVAVYDSVNAYAPGTQPDFCLQLAAELGARAIVDLGCGTGLVTCALARAGYELTGVDPQRNARDRPHAAGGERVRWINGYAADLPPAGTVNADLAIMTGHVAQFFVTDESWRSALTALHRSVRPGGRLAFESRNPGAREWSSGRRMRPRRWSIPLPAASTRGRKCATCATASSRMRTTTCSRRRGTCWCPKAGCVSARTPSSGNRSRMPASGWSASTATGIADPRDQGRAS